MSETPATLAQAREEFLRLVAGLRPILLAFEGGKVSAIHDYRYVPYIALEAEIEQA